MSEDPKKLIRHLSACITERRMEMFERILDFRTRYITVVLEDIYQPHNASAVMRSCECFGIQDVHIIENKNEYRINPDVVMGASKWLSISRYRVKDQNTVDSISALRENGYRIIATIPDGEGSVSLEEFDIKKGKFALLFGTELTGLTPIARKLAEESVRIPIYGFTDSFNISVSAAIILHHLTLDLYRSDVTWKLTEQERDELMINWLIKSIKHLRGKSPKAMDNLD